MRSQFNGVSIVEAHFAIFLFGNVFCDKCGENEASVATFVANIFLMLDNAALNVAQMFLF